VRPTFVSVSTVVAVLCFAAPLATEAQIGKVARVGFLYFGSRETGAAPGRYAAFLEGLRELGYVEGKTVIVEARFAESRAERIPDLVADLMRLKVEVIVAADTG
jgi:putative tryptophan/tyrosine transport system substrate-binding protein